MPTRIVYITGQSYSGSTFVCALLGVHPDMAPVSELANWPKKGLYPRRQCSCGKLSKDCDFWVGVRRRWIEQFGPAIAEQYVELQARLERLSYVWPQMLGAPAPRSTEFLDYRAKTVALYQNIAAESGRPIIVDSSKRAARALAISTMEELEVSVIHLTRNSRDYLDSCLRRGKVRAEGPDSVFQVFRLGLKWAVTNRAAEMARMRASHRGAWLRFEDLVTRPADALDSLGSALQIDLSCIRDHVADKLPVSYAHMESGSRHRRSGPARLRTELADPAPLDRRLSLAFRLGAGLVARRYGYS